jgi:uncharacterized membrane protein YccC
MSVSTWRRVVADALSFNTSALTIRDGARMAVGTTVPLMVGFAAGSWASGAAAAGGALAVGITSVIPSARPRVAVLASVAASMALGTFVGSATSGYPVLHVIVGALLAFVFGLLVAVETTYAGAGINGLVAFLVYGRFAASPAIAARTAGLVAAGALLQLAFVLVLRRRPRTGRALIGLSRAYDALADFASRLDVDESSLPVAAAIDAAVTDLDFSFRVDEAREAWTSLAGEAHRVRLELLSLGSGRSNIQSPDAELRRVLVSIAGATARYLKLVARSLAAADVMDGADEALDAVDGAVQELDQLPTQSVHDTDESHHAIVRAGAAARALAGQLRAVSVLLPVAVESNATRPVSMASMRSASRISKRGVRGAELIAQRMRANLTPDSDACRHALRLAIVVTVATGLAQSISLGRGYWVALTAVLVLRPEFSITFTRGVARAAGTVVGVGIATGIDVLVHPHGWVLVAFVAGAVWSSGAVFNASYTVFSVAVTGVVVFLLAGLDTHSVATGEDRLLATVLGAGLALGAYAAFPTWGSRPASQAVAKLAAATHDYVIAVLRSTVDPTHDRAHLVGLSRSVRLARTNAETALGRSFADPGSRRLDAHTSAEILACLRRLSIAGHTLRFRRPVESRPWSPAARRALTLLVDSLDIELNAVAARLGFGRVAYRHEALRERHRAFLAEANRYSAESPVEGLIALVAAETDEMVDAINSLNAVLDRLVKPIPVAA